jgi:hypothetical protein
VYGKGTWPRVGDQIGQRWAVYQLKYERPDTLSLFDAIDRGNVRMIE